MKPLTFALLLLTFYISAVASTASYFSCPARMQGPPCEEFGRADSVFAGTVIKVTKVPFPSDSHVYWQTHQKLVATLRVDEVFRGELLPADEIVFDMANCYYPFEEGRSYLVYANKDANGKLYQRIGETRTGLLSEAAEDLEYIRGLVDAPEGGRIFGRAFDHTQLVSLRLNNQPTNRAAAIPGLKIIAEGAGKAFGTVTNEKGEFELSGLPQGDYDLRAQLPGYLSGTEEKARLAEKGCASVNFSIQAIGEIGGRVLNANGEEVSDVTVSIFSAEGVTNERLESVQPYFLMRDTTDDRGRFHFVRLPSGRYYLAINLVKEEIRPDSPLAGYRRTFYPGVHNLEDASAVILDNGQKQQNIIIRLPADAKQGALPSSIQ